MMSVGIVICMTIYKLKIQVKLIYVCTWAKHTNILFLLSISVYRFMNLFMNLFIYECLFRDLYPKYILQYFLIQNAFKSLHVYVFFDIKIIHKLLPVHV